MKASYAKASHSCIDKFFLWERHENGDCWRTEEIIELELGLISRAIDKKTAIKNQITIWVKGFEIRVVPSMKVSHIRVSQ